MAKKELQRRVDEVLSKMDRSKLITILRNLIKIPSYLGQEEAKADYVAHELERLGLEVIEMPLSTADAWRRRNVLGILKGDGGGKSLMICAHLDTHSPVEGQFSPHEGIIKDGKIYGVGTGDSIAPMAAFLGAIDTIKKSGVLLKGDLIFAGTVDELGHKQGAQMIIESGIKADMCIEGDVGNPLEIYICHTGKAELEIRTKGYTGYLVGAWAERSGLKAVNAVISMNKIINYLFRMVEEEPYFHKKHPLLPGEGAGLYIGPIIGGSVGYGLPTRIPGKGPGPYGLALPAPTWCRLRVGVRYWPGQTSEEFIDLVKKWVNKAKAEDPSLEAEVELYLDGLNTPWEISSNAEIVNILRRSVKYVWGKQPKLTGMISSGELPFYKRAGMQGVWYGSNMRCNTPDEHVTIEELTNMCKVFTLSILETCT